MGTFNCTCVNGQHLTCKLLNVLGVATALGKAEISMYVVAHQQDFVISVVDFAGI